MVKDLGQEMERYQNDWLGTERRPTELDTSASPTFEDIGSGVKDSNPAMHGVKRKGKRDTGADMRRMRQCLQDMKLEQDRILRQQEMMLIQVLELTQFLLASTDGQHDVTRQHHDVTGMVLNANIATTVPVMTSKTQSLPLSSMYGDQPRQARGRHFEATTPAYGVSQARLYDLPLFSGLPENWPRFKSAYDETTQAFGYTNLQNLL